MRNNIVCIICPFWGDPTHIGNYRVERFIRWLSNENYSVIIITSGKKLTYKKTDYGQVIELKSNIYSFINNVRKNFEIKKKKSLLIIFNLIVETICIPSCDILFAKKLFKLRNKIQILSNVDLFISSSPPEAVHIANRKISKYFNRPFIIDMRDGWIDEPLNTKILRFPLRRFIEQKMERSSLLFSSHIFVTSNNWKKLLNDRLTFTKGKTTVITNSYPKIDSFTSNRKNKFSNWINLVYAGRFISSRATNKADFLFDPFLKFNRDSSSKINIKLLGDFRRKDNYFLEQKKKQLTERNIIISTQNRLPREKMFEQLNQSDGLLLLAVSKAFIPSKIFEYIIFKKPIFAVTTVGSSIWEMSGEIPQMFICEIDGDQVKNHGEYVNFLKACQSGNHDFAIPEKYSEEYLSRIFTKKIKSFLEN